MTAAISVPSIAPARTRRRSLGNRAARALRIVIILFGVVVNLVMQVGGWVTTPAVYLPDIAWVTLHSGVPIVFAVCAIIASRVGIGPLPIGLMIGITYLWIPQTFFTVINLYGAIAPFVRSIDLVWALGIGLLALAYPHGRYEARIDKVIVGLGIGLSVLRGLAVILLDQPDPLICGCAANPYAILDDPALFQGLNLAYRIGGAAIVLFIAARLFVRWVRSSAPARTVAFVMPIGLTAWTLALITEAISYGLKAPETGPIAVISLFAVASVPICYVAGFVHLRNTRGRVADLMRITKEGADRPVWEESLATTLRDPTLEVFWWDDALGGYRTSDGEVGLQGIDVPADGQSGEESGETSTLLPIRTDEGNPIAVIRHDKALMENERLLDGVSTALRLAVDNGQLRSEVQRTLEHVRESRQRIVEAGDEARKRLERNLHDGSQQQLVAVAMELRTVCTAARAAGQHDLAAEIEVVLERLSSALRELRELARGIHPTVLVEGGLGLALPELASRCPIPVSVETHLPDRLPELVESTVYFVTSECLVNIARHSQARQAWLRIDADEENVHLVIRDNGIGGVDTEEGSGVVGLVDRVEALGGTVTVRSPAGEGTTIDMTLSLDFSNESGLV